MDLSLKVDVVNNISTEEFKSKYLKTQTPLVIKGLTRDTDAGQKWSLDYFKETMGDTKVDLYDNRNTKSDASAYTTPDLQMKFSEFLNILSTNESTPYRIFLFNLFKHNPVLRKEFPCPKVFKGVLDKIGYMFFASKDTPVRIHFDTDLSNVMLTQFEGRKRVVLFAPEYNEMLYCLPLNTYSLIDIDKPDYDKYPALRYVKGYEVILEPGDSIFMPSCYWHYMTYLDSGFCVSYRKLAPTFSIFLQGVINLALYIPIDKMLNNMMGVKWLERKKSIAEKRANRAIKNQNINPEFNTVPEIV